MRCLIVEDDFISRKILRELLRQQFDTEIAVDGEEAIIAFRMAHEAKTPFDLVCMDIMMPKVDGKDALLQMRQMEKELAVPPNMECKIIMITAQDDPKSIFDAYYKGGATSYLVKPVSRQKLFKELRTLGFIGQDQEF